jgi:hypothetical protein
MTRRGLMACAALAAVLMAAPVRAQPALEYDVKAAFLLNFARFIEWPDAAFPDARAPINVCVFGTSPFGDALGKVFQGESVGNRPLEVRRVDNAREAAPCHLIFVPAAAEARAGALLRETDSRAVTVGESQRFLALGGAVNLVLDGGRVRFNVNLQPVERRGVRISARLLQLATHVDRATPEK